MSTQVLQRLSHNRRRWSHVFPDGEDEFQLAEAGRVPGPNWRSLSTPAVLPVETDVLPEDFGRANAFEEANHSIVFTVSTDEAAGRDRRADGRATDRGRLSVGRGRAGKASLAKTRRVAAHARGPRRATDGPVPAQRARLVSPVATAAVENPEAVDLHFVHGPSHTSAGL